MDPAAKLRQSILDKPALAPPPGVHPNFDNPPSLHVPILVLATLFCVLTTLMVAIRIFTKLKVVHRLVVEDYLLLIAWLIYTGGFTAIAYIGAHGFGAHQWNMKIGQLIRYLYVFHIGVILYGLVILPLKCAIILQCLRVFVPSGTRNSTFWVSHILIWMNVVFYIIITFLVAFTCQPEAKAYDPTIQGGKCLDSAVISITTTVLNTISDLLMFVIPQKIIWDLSLPVSRRWALSCAFLVGILACMASLMRLYYSVKLKGSHDAAYFVGRIALWAYPEMGFGFFVVCLPTLPKFYNYVSQRPEVAEKMVKFYAMFSKTKQEPRRLSWAGMQGENRTFGGTPQSRHLSRHQISDLEYHELVANTGNTSLVRSERRNSLYAGKGGSEPPEVAHIPEGGG